jgi:ATP phosphoribosyltransferase regulatory subunit
MALEALASKQEAEQQAKAQGGLELDWLDP